MAEEGDDIKPSPVPFKGLKKHIEELEKRLEYPYWDGFDKEWRPLSRLYEQPPKTPLQVYETAIRPENRDKNRYGNALPPEETRFKLTSVKQGESDYVNANVIQDNGEKYILTQGPMPETFTDFWRMVWDSKSSVIVMLTREIENGRPKCERYWEEEKGKLFRTGPFTVELLKQEVQDNGELFVREFKLTNSDVPNEERQVFQYQYTAWPDQGIPPTFNSFLDIVKWVDQKKASAPVVVHCSAGLGRSGAFAMVHASLKKLERELAEGKEPSFDMASLVLNMRKQRHGLIQTGKQFEFVYRAIAEGTEKVLQEKK